MKVFIVGQSNVGKSFLFNLLIGKNIAITQNEFNTTIDNISYKMGNTILFDTPGLRNKDDIKAMNADVFLYKIRSGLDEIDKNFLKEIYKTKIPVIFACEELFNSSGEKYLTDHNGISQLRIRLSLTEADKREKPLVVIIGRENSGKSTLMNCILGYDRCLVSSEAGTTKDSIVEETKGFYFADTAGYCKEKNYMHWLISQKRIEILKECDGVILLLDGSQLLSRIEKQLLQECKKYSKFCVVAVNKTDLASLESKMLLNYFNFGNFLTCKICAKNKDIQPLFYSLRKSFRNSQKLISTSHLNTWLKDQDFKLVDNNNNPVKIKYMIQSSSTPMSFKYFSPKPLQERCERFVLRKLCEYFKLQGVNISFKIFHK